MDILSRNAELTGIIIGSAIGTLVGKLFGEWISKLVTSLIGKLLSLVSKLLSWIGHRIVRSEQEMIIYLHHKKHAQGLGHELRKPVGCSDDECVSITK